LSTPNKIKNLLPGEYQVRIEYPGYWPWEKKLEIKPGESTFAEDIILFRNEIPLNLYPENFEAIFPALNSDLALVNNKEKIAIIDIKKSQIISSINLPLAGNNWQWSPDKKYFSNGKSVYSPKNLNSGIKLPLIFDNINTPLVWQNNNKLLAIHEKDIVTYSINDKKLQNFPQSDVLVELKSDQKNVYSLKNNSTNSIVSIIDSDNYENTYSINLPLSDYKFLNESPALLDVYDIKNDILYLIDPFSVYNPLLKTIEKAKINSWINESQFVHSDGHEIWLTDLSKGQNLLIARYSAKIKRLFWHKSKNYIIFSTDKYIATIELDKRDKYNITYLIKNKNIKDAALSQDGSHLLFINNEGAYQLVLE
jgi:hypothetical protein